MRATSLPPAIALLSTLLALAPTAGAEWSVEDVSGTLRLLWRGDRVAEYVYDEQGVSRPYFANLRTPDGLLVTRNHPPIEGLDRPDHPDFHPGVWLAFGDLNGADSWRRRTPIRHERFVAKPVVEADQLRFAVEHTYIGPNGEELAKGNSSHCLQVSDEGLLLTFDETLTAERAVTFGDQEEMGFGVRVATPLRVEQRLSGANSPGNGEMVADGGRRGAREIWGQTARWLDYRGMIDQFPAGVAVFCHPQNPSPSRMHARDYGFVCANAFAAKAFGLSEPTIIRLPEGESLRLRYAVLCHSGKELTDDEIDNAYRSYVDAY